jgi:hypothetical protein
LLRSSDGHMYLAGVPVFSIMLIGRWSSTAFLKYIRKQVQEFLQGISSKMIEVQSFKHVKPNRNKPNGEHSWRLVFVADGLNWWRKHHHQKDGGGDEPINNRGSIIKYFPSAPFFQFLVRPPYQKFLFSELWRWVRDRRFMTNWASTTRPPNCHPCTFSCMQYWFQSRDALSVPLEDPDRGTDEAAVCSGKCTQC